MFARLGLLGWLITAWLADACASAEPLSLEESPKLYASVRFTIIPAPVSSHFAICQPIMDELLQRGHQIQLVYPREGLSRVSRQLLQHPNVTLGAYAGPLSEFDLRQAVKDPDRKAGLKSSEREFGASEHSHAMLQDADLQTRIQDFEPDLMLVDLLVFGGMATADKYGIPKAMLIPAAAPPMLNYMIGSGSHLLATVPQFNSALPRGMTFWQRLKNFGYFASAIGLWEFKLLPPVTNNIWQAHKIAPYSAKASLLNISVTLVNVDWANNNPQPMPPHAVACGALTAKHARPLPAHLQSFVQSAGDAGVVFASLGTTAIPEATEVMQIAKALTAIAPAKVVWKLADQDMQLVGLNSSTLQVGSNVKIVNWAPQQDLLGHPNVKAFFTQGGMNSFNEAAYHGVPIVAMPLFGEQPDNVAIAVEKGWGLAVKVHPLPRLAMCLQQALTRVLQEPAFAQRAAAVSKLMKARRWAPAEVAASKLL